MATSVEPARVARPFEVGSGDESVESSDLGRRRSEDKLDALVPAHDLSIGPMPRQDTAAPATGAESSAVAARPVGGNLAQAPQPLAGSAAEPGIRVTIGRVEVRAVLPEQPVKRSAPPRFKPSVSLDDYLSRGSGARR